MGRAGYVVAGLVALVLAGTTVWALNERRNLEVRVARLEDALDDSNERIAAAATARRALAEASTTMARRAKASSRKANALESRLYGARLGLQRIRPVADALVPPGREVSQVNLLRGALYDLLVVDWNEGLETITLSGIDVWRVPRTAERRGRWELVYIAEPHPSFELDRPSYVLSGPPTSPTREEVEFIQMIDSADAGDATGDGLEDLAIREMGPGSGGCGYVKLLRNTGDTLQEVYRHEDCDHGLAIKRGHLVLGQSWHPPGCDHIHGCGRRGTWMRWTGSAWVVTKVTRDAY
ncbi:MAG: hypothetical protein ABR613_09255 [Actinomycetota bacterium]